MVPYEILNQRTSIRWAAIGALINADVPPYPTQAGDRVYDSRQDPIIHNGQHREIPMIAVYTDADQMAPINPHMRGALPLMHMVQLVLELSMTGFSMDTLADRELELKLDNLEAEVLNALFNPASEPAQRFMTTFKSVEGIVSNRLADSRHEHRLAQRDLVITLKYDGSCSDLKKAFPNFERWVANVAINDNIVSQVDKEIPQ